MTRLPQFLTPAPVQSQRPGAGTGEGRYVSSFLFERLVIGALGVTLPLIVVFVDWLWLGSNGDPVPRDSLSAYYYSGLREWFVLTIGTTGFFLIAYKLTENNLDNTLSIVGGLCAILIPLFPTARTAKEKLDGVPLNPLQHHLGEHTVQLVHIGASTGFIVALGGVSLLFAQREGERHEHGNRRSGHFWRNFHRACAGFIALAGIWIVVTVLLKLWDGPDWSLFAGETTCTLAFGASWFAKGYEIEHILRRRKARDGRRRFQGAPNEHPTPDVAADGP